MSAVIRAERLGRWYGQVIGLSDLSVSIERGIIGLLGPNGAGKSTLLKLIAGELRPSRGAIEVLGLVPFANRALLRRIGFCPQQDALYEHMNGSEFVSFLLRLHGFDRRSAASKAARAIERVGLQEHAERRVNAYSKGMRQRLRIAQAIAHDPELLIADEPLSGLDPVGRREMLALFGELAQGGMNVLMSSHVLHEIEQLTQEVLVLHRGRLLAQGTIGDIRKLLNQHPRKIEIATREPRALASALIANAPLSALRFDQAQLVAETSDADKFLAELTRLAGSNSFGVERLASRDESLEAVFDYLIG